MRAGSRAGAAALALAATLGAAAPATAIVDHETDAGGITFDGRFRALTLFGHALALEGIPSQPAETFGVALARARLQVHGWAGDLFEAELAWELAPQVGGLRAALAGAADGPTTRLRLGDPPRTIAEGPTAALRHDLDRLWIALRGRGYELRVGRQPLGHGSARLLDAADPFAPFGAAAIDTEYKRGVDAVRLRVDVDMQTLVEAIVVAHRDGVDHLTALARLQRSFEAADLSVLAGLSLGRPTLAFDLTAPVDITVLYVQALLRAHAPLDAGLRATAGVEILPHPDVQVVVEAHFNGPGADSPAGYLAATTTDAYLAGESALLGRAYTAVSIGGTPHPLLRLQLLWLANWSDRSQLLAPGLSADVGPETTLGLGALLGFGTRRAPDAVSEFGATPLSGYVEVRTVF